MVEPVDRDSRGLVHPQAGLQHFVLDRRAPADAVARFIDRYWFVAWDLPPGHVHHQQVVIHPTVNVVFEAGEARVGGPRDERFVRELRGAGQATGVMARPGGFAAFTDRPVVELCNTQLPMGDLFGSDADVLAARLADTADVDTHTALLDEWFAARVPAEPHPAEQAVAIADIVIGDPTLNRVEDLADAAGISVRHLQRLFITYVGMSPKQVIRRYRIYEVAERVAHGESVRWADVAADLGFADQAHLTREFTAMFGMPPATYARMSAH